MRAIPGRAAERRARRRPVAVFAATAINVLYALVPAGQPRDRGKLVVSGLLALVVLARLYLGVDHPPTRWSASCSGSRSRWPADGCWSPTTSSR